MIEPLGGLPYLWPFALAFLVGYLAGSVPCGLLLARAAGAGDVRRIGSGNIGATNVLRTGRKGLAALTLVADAGKGGVPVWLAFAWLGPDIAVLVGLGAVLGHCFPVWLKFKGGKGVATAAGVILALTPLVILPAFAVFVALVGLTRFVSLGSIAAAIVAPLTSYLFGNVQAAELYLVLAVIITAKHYQNIGRLLRGQEAKLSFSTRR